MYVPISVFVSVLSFVAGIAAAFGVGLWASKRQQAQTQKWLEAAKGAEDQEDVALEQD